jgi:hypothetical protein
MQEYEDFCRTVFGQPIDSPNSDFHIPFARKSEAGERLLRFLWQEENRMVGPFFEEIHSHSIPGCLIEFGVFQGSALNRMLLHCERIGLVREVYGFDSFEGLPEPSPYDPPQWYKGKFETKLELVQSRLNEKKRKNLHLVKGWFCDTLSTRDIQERITEVAYARIDCDLYQSTWDCLRFLEGRLSNGAFMTFDDWLHRSDQGETKAFIEWHETVKDKYRFEFLYTIAQGISHFRVWHV